MAQKPLRSIKFPGLSDVYTVPEGGSGGGSGGSVQADWSQNDAQAADFVKNRMGAYMTDPVATEIYNGTLPEMAEIQMDYVPTLGDVVTVKVGTESIDCTVGDTDGSLYFATASLEDLEGGTATNYVACVYLGPQWMIEAGGTYIGQNAVFEGMIRQAVKIPEKFLELENVKDVYWITFEFDQQTKTYFSKKIDGTYAEYTDIKAAIDNGKLVAAVASVFDESNNVGLVDGYGKHVHDMSVSFYEVRDISLNGTTFMNLVSFRWKNGHIWEKIDGSIKFSYDKPMPSTLTGKQGDSDCVARSDHSHPERTSIQFLGELTDGDENTVACGNVSPDTPFVVSGLNIPIGAEITLGFNDYTPATPVTMVWGGTATIDFSNSGNFWRVNLAYNACTDAYTLTTTRALTNLTLTYKTVPTQTKDYQKYVLAPYTVAPHLLLASPNGLHKLTVDDNGNVLVDGESIDGTDKSLGITGAAAGKIPKIKAVDAAGNPTEWEAAEMPASGPTDAQVSSAVDTWLTEHPEATTTVQDGAVTPQKTSFLEREFESIMDLGEYKKTFSYSIKNDGSYYIHTWNKNYNFKADITGLTKIVIHATAAYINYVFFAEAPTGATGQTVVGHGGTFAGQTKLNETDANAPTAQTVTIDVPDNAVWLMVDFGYAQPTELMIGKPLERWKFGGQIDKTVNGADIVDETVDTPKLADGAVTTEKLANQSVSTDKLEGYSTVRRDVPWELFLDGYGTSINATVESAACAIYSMKFEAGKTYCILNLPYPNNTNELVADPTDIQYFGRYFSYYPSLPDVEANIAAGKDRLYGYKKADNIQQALLKAESDGYVETAIPGQALSMPPVYFTAKQDWYVLRASTKPEAGKRINNYYVSELQMTGISTLGNGMNGQLWHVYKKDLGNGYAKDSGYLQQIFASKTANAENERAYAAMSRDVPRDRTLSIQFIGDSITYAASNAGLQNAFRKYVPMNLRAETMALCQSGVSVTTGSGSFDWNGKQNTDTAYDAAMSGYSGLAQKLAEYKTNLSLAAWADAVDIVVVELGTNDHWEQATLGSPTDLTEDTNFYGAVEKTLMLLEDTFPHAQILWMLPFKNQKWKTSTIKLVDYLIALKILCQTHTRCWVLDLFDKWFLDYDDADLRSKFFIDNVHITGDAHKCVAESMIDKIRQIISVCGLRQIETVHATNANDSVYGSANA